MGIQRNPPAEYELPEAVHVTPSRPNPWRSAKAKGARFTYPQIRAMRDAGIDPDKVDDGLGVVRCRSRVSPREMWWPTCDSTPFYVFDCPVLAIRANGFRLVIAPNGDRKIAHESGRLDRHRSMEASYGR